MVVGVEAKGHTVVLPFTMQEVLDEYMALTTADQREDFWRILGERLAHLDEDQKALFVLSWSRSLAESSASLDKTFAEIAWHRANVSNDK